MTSTKTRGKRDDLYSLDKYIVKMHHSAAGTAWRWRTELIVLSGLGAALYWLSRQIAMHWAPVVLAAASASPSACRGRGGSSPAGSGACWPATASTGCAGKPGCTPAPDGCPWSCGPAPPRWASGCSSGAGLASAPTTSPHNSGELAAACYAREARVTRNTAWSQIVTIDIIRRDTLAARHQVGTPLSRLMDTYAAYIGGEPVLHGVIIPHGPAPWPQPTVPSDPGSPEQAA